VAPKNPGSEPQKSGQSPSRANARRDEVRRQAEATKAETNARILTAFSAELTSYRTARELAAATGLADSTLGPRLHQLLADGHLVQDADGIHRPRPGARLAWFTDLQAEGKRQLAQRRAQQDAQRARQAAYARVDQALLVLDEAGKRFGDQAQQSPAIASDVIALMGLRKRMNSYTDAAALELDVAEVFELVESPLAQWAEARRQRDQALAAQQAELERGWQQWAPNDFRCMHGLRPGAAHQNAQVCPVPAWVQQALQRLGGRRTRKQSRTGDVFGYLAEASTAGQLPALPPPMT
jgi:hypothetical protein